MPKDAVAGPSKSKKKRTAQLEPHCDYLEGKSKSANRQRIDPQVVLSNILETIINELRNEPDSAHFLFPVSAKVSQGISNFQSYVILIGNTHPSPSIISAKDTKVES